MPAWRRFLGYWFLPETVKRAVTVASVGAPILTVINQHEAILALDFRPRFFAKLALTSLVPYCVSSFSSARALMRREDELKESRRLA